MQALIWGLKCLLSMLRGMLGSVKGVKSENPKGEGKLGIEKEGVIEVKYPLTITPSFSIPNFPSPLGFSLLTPFTLPSMPLSMLSKHFRPHISACISVSFQT